MRHWAIVILVTTCWHGSVMGQAPAPAENVQVGPCFLVASSEPGLAAPFAFEVSPIGSQLPGRAW